MKLVAIHGRRPVLATRIVLTFVVLGALSNNQLGLAQYNEIVRATVT